VANNTPELPLWLTNRRHLLQNSLTIVIGHEPVCNEVGTQFKQFVAFLVSPFAQKMSEVLSRRCAEIR